MVQVPGTAWPGSGHCAVMAGFTFVFQASGTAPNSEIRRFPQGGPTKLTRSRPARARHRIFGILVVIDRERGYQNIEMGGILDIRACRILCRLRDRPAGLRLHLVGGTRMSGGTTLEVLTAVNFMNDAGTVR